MTLLGNYPGRVAFDPDAVVEMVAAHTYAADCVRCGRFAERNAPVEWETLSPEIRDRYRASVRAELEGVATADDRS